MDEGGGGGGGCLGTPLHFAGFNFLSNPGGGGRRDKEDPGHEAREVSDLIAGEVQEPELSEGPDPRAHRGIRGEGVDWEGEGRDKRGRMGNFCSFVGWVSRGTVSVHILADKVLGHK